MTQLTVGSLFSGIGGLDLGLERAGMRVAWQCEIDEWCRGILKRHWPDVPCYDDVRSISGDNLERVDGLVGGFPCQPVSNAGKRSDEYQDDPRWVWPHFARLVGELRPRFVLVENVPGLRGRGLGIVTGDLAALGYDAEWNVVSAAAVGAPHLRKRLFIVAYAIGSELRIEPGRISGPGRESSTLFSVDGTQRPTRFMADAECTAGIGERAAGGTLFQPGPLERLGRRCSSDGGQWAAEPGMGRVAHGVSARLDRLRGLGNAVVPQVAEYVGRLIVEAAA